MPEQINRSSVEEKLEITDTRHANYDIGEGSYKAAYAGVYTAITDTAWGEKKIAKIKFTISNGQYQGESVYFRGNFMKENATGRWIIGTKSKLAAVIKAINPKGNFIDSSMIGKPVIIRVKKVTLKNGDVISVVDGVIEDPDVKHEPQVPATPKTVAPVAPVVTNKPENKSINTNVSIENELKDLVNLDDYDM